MTNWQGKKVIVIGAARQGLAAARFLANQGANVTLTDSRSQEAFPNIRDEVDVARVKCVFGDHPTELLKGADYVSVSGGVPLTIPFIQDAIKNGIPLTNDAQIFLELCPAQVIGITGSAGKTTTTTLIGEIAREAIDGSQKAWVGGNIGFPLIDHIDEIDENDWVVMELSSFQLELMKNAPDIALVLNITPNHLDRHKTMKAYTNAKANILKYQMADSKAILNRENPGSFQLKDLVKGNLTTFGYKKPSDEIPGTFVETGWVKFSEKGEIIPILPLEEIKLVGNHNLMNVLASCAAGIAAGFSFDAIKAGISIVKGIPHRLELIRRANGVNWFNDSIATAPERVIAALDTIRGSIVLLLGGRDKDLPWGDLIQKIADRNAKVILFGEAADLIESAFHAQEYEVSVHAMEKANTLEQAVCHAAEIAERGDSVLLSPGCTSYDAFFDFEERGNLFREIVENLE